MLAAPDTAAQLMKLRETEAVRVLDDHDAGIGHVYAYFDDRGCDKDIKLLVAVTAHDLVFIRRFHCAMQQAKAQVGENMLAQAFVLDRHRFDDQPQTPEVHILLNEGMGTDGNHGLAVFDGGPPHSALALAQAASEQGGTNAEWLEHGVNAVRVLLGQYLGGSHNGALVAIESRHEQGSRRHGSFAGADISLQETRHGLCLRKVGKNFAYDTLLSTGETKRQGGLKRPAGSQGGPECRRHWGRFQGGIFQGKGKPGPYI